MWATQLATALSQEGNTTAFPILSPQPTFFWIYRDTSGCLSLADRQSVPTPATSLRTRVSTLAQNIKTCRLRARASGHEMQNLFGSSRNTDAGQAVGRRPEGRAKMKMTQRQNIDTLDWNIENVSNYLWGMLTYSTVILKNCVKILSVACIKLLLYHHISRNRLMDHKSKAPLIIFARSLADIC